VLPGREATGHRHDGYVVYVLLLPTLTGFQFGNPCMMKLTWLSFLQLALTPRCVLPT
jgi:hypothetical protein